MEGWKIWEGKHVYIILRNNRRYTGKIVDVDISEDTLIWITLIDKFGERVTIVHSEIIEIKEERE